MYEDIKPLFANPVLSLLAIALADYVFQNYGFFEEIETILLFSDGFLHHLRIRKNMFYIFFFQIVSADRSIGKIYKASFFSNRTVNLGYRVGYKKNIGIYDIRREALVKVDSKFLWTEYSR